MFQNIVAYPSVCPKCHGEGGRWKSLRNSAGLKYQTYVVCKCQRRKIAAVAVTVEIDIWEAA